MMRIDEYDRSEGGSLAWVVSAARAQPSCTLCEQLSPIDSTRVCPLLLRQPLHRSIGKMFALYLSEDTETVYYRPTSRRSSKTRRGRAWVAGSSRAPRWPCCCCCWRCCTSARRGGGQRRRPDVRERVALGGSVASSARASRMKQETARGDVAAARGVLYVNGREKGCVSIGVVLRERGVDNATTAPERR